MGIRECTTCFNVGKRREALTYESTLAHKLLILCSIQHELFTSVWYQPVYLQLQVISFLTSLFTCLLQLCQNLDHFLLPGLVCYILIFFHAGKYKLSARCMDITVFLNKESNLQCKFSTPQTHNIMSFKRQYALF
jgi:hypothetical protein